VGVDLGTGDGIFKGIMMLEGEPEMLRHDIQLMGSQVRQCLAACLEAAQVRKLDGR
jgi:bacterioferritin (cytochrome b1)